MEVRLEELRRRTIVDLPSIWTPDFYSFMVNGDAAIIRKPWLPRRSGVLIRDSWWVTGWVSLLTRIEDGYSFNKGGNSVSIDTDYPPSDLQAAPALGTIRAVVELVALADCDRIERVDDYLMLRGANMQLSFRNHPALGTVAVCQSLLGIGTYDM